MKIIIIGNNVAGTFTAQNIRHINKDVEIEIFTQEKYPYYTRIKLPELISEQITINDLIVFKEEWYKKNNIRLNLEKKIIKINSNEKTIFIENEQNPIKYDKLIIATGSLPNIPPIRNAKENKDKGVFTLRTIDDALEIRDFIKKKNVKKAIIIGGGLLGLELAKQIKNCQLDTTVVEFFPRLLPKQLDTECGEMLKEEIEEMGINVLLDAATEEILINTSVHGIRLKDGRELEADVILIQAGIIPTIDLATGAKLRTNRGIIVNQYLETSEPDIYAVGDCIEYKNQTWGIIPAAMEQARILAASILKEQKLEYKGTVPKNTLKIVGIDLTSIGEFDPTEGEGAGWNILRKADKENCCYKKIVLKDNKLKGAILFGEKKGLNYVNKNIEAEVDERELRETLELYVWACPNCGFEYDDAKMNPLFEYLPKDWKCRCGTPKNEFIKKPN